MLADFYRDGVRASTLKKLLRLLDGYAKTPAGEVGYGHIEQILHAFENEQYDKEQALCGMIRMMLDAFSTHLDPDSGLYAHIKILQTRLTPPLSLAEINALNDYMEFTSDEVTQFDLTENTAIAQTMQPLFNAFAKRDNPGNPDVASIEEINRRQSRRRQDGRRIDDNVHYLKRRELSPISPVDERAELISRNLSHAQAPVLQQDIETSVAQSEAFVEVLQGSLDRLKNADKQQDFEHQRLVILQELETVISQHSEITGQFVKVSYYLSQVQNDSDRLNEELHRVTKLSLTDELTGLPNRRAFITRLHEEVSRVQRYGHELAIALLDLDYFKMINDTYGHPAGDAVLVQYADSVLNRLREHDMLARYGGEEFAIIFPNTEAGGAVRALENIQQTVAEFQCEFEQKTVPLPTFSCGLAIYEPGESMDSLIKRADQALYRAKKNGRNQVVTGDEALSP